MGINRAIRELDAAVMMAQNEGNFERANAIKLGIEALRRIKDWRASGVMYSDSKLSGETED